MRLLKQSTEQELTFLMVSSADHVTPMLGLGPSVELRKSLAIFESPAGAVEEIGYGWYKVAGNVADTDTLGSLILHAEAFGADPIDREYEVVEQFLVASLYVPTDEPVAIVLAPTTPDKSIGYTIARNGVGDLVPGATFYFSLRTGPTPDSYATKEGKFKADEAGLAQYGFKRGAAYRVKRGRTGGWKEFTVPNEESFQLPQTLGES